MEDVDDATFNRKRSKRPLKKRIVIEYNEAARNRFVTGFQGNKKKKKKIALKQRLAKEKALRRKMKSDQKKKMLEQVELLNPPPDKVGMASPTVKVNLSNNVVEISEIDLSV